MKNYSLAALIAAAVTAGSATFAQDTYEMVMTNELATSHWTAKMMDNYAATIEERSEGRIDVSVFHSGTLYTDRDAIAALGTGGVHMVWPVSVNLESIAPEYGVVNLPFSLTDAFMQSEGAVPELSDMMSKIIEGRGIRVMGLMRTADLIFLFKEKAITQPSDLSGERVRMTGGRVLQSMMREFGASPISMPATEMAAALMQGAIDGIFTSAGGWEMVGTNAAQTASYIPGLSLLSYTIVADDKWINSLPEDLRKVVVDATNELVAMQWQEGIDKDKATMQMLLDQGGTLVTADDAAIAEFRALAETASAEFTDRFPEVWEQFQALKAKYE
ncbi:TRAP transporter substrate-binding protein DctP [Rhodobacteraceae bacterium KMM 6894]|nr:TRAP transporter substrate-binding protein DctP [Rhodobacteraceae bacterium KMM 6894]